jgi:uncharacterized protein DUF6894
MSLYYFCIPEGPYSGASDQGIELADQNAAWAEMTKVCGDLVGSISRNLKQNTEWQMELLDESKKLIFRIRLVAETLD